MGRKLHVVQVCFQDLHKCATVLCVVRTLLKKRSPKDSKQKITLQPDCHCRLGTEAMVIVCDLSPLKLTANRFEVLSHTLVGMRTF